jgi:hypothetical protein
MVDLVAPLRSNELPTASASARSLDASVVLANAFTSHHLTDAAAWPTRLWPELKL